MSIRTPGGTWHGDTVSELATQCEHEFEYLRQERRNVGYERNPIWLIEDVFFCYKCLQYRRKPIEKRTPKNDGGENVERLV